MAGVWGGASRGIALLRAIENAPYAWSGLNGLWLVRIFLDLLVQPMNGLSYEVSLSLVLRAEI